MPVKKGLNCFWEPLGLFSEPTSPTDLISPRGWQIHAIAEGSKHPYNIINAPTGSGKSVVAELIIAERLMQNPQALAIIAFPTSQIAQNFAHETLKMPDGSPCWSPVNCCDEVSNYNKSKRLINWLQSQPGSSINNRVAICTYSTLLRIPRELLLAVKPLVWFDEAHHSNCTHGQENATGQLLKQLIKVGAEVGLSTATLFRGDRCSIIPEEERARFHHINVSFEEHLRSMRHISGLSYDFHTYDESPEATLAALLADKKPTIVYLPYVKSAGWKCSKQEQVQKIVNMFKGTGCAHETQEGVMVAGDQYIVDLVSEHKLAEKQRYIGNGKINKVD